MVNDKVSKARKLRKAAQNSGDNAAKSLERTCKLAEKRFKDLGKTKLSILQGSIRRFNAHYSRLTNFEEIAPDDQEKERLLQFNDTLPDMENTVGKVSILLADGIKSVNEGTLESLGVFGVIESLGTESVQPPESRKLGAALGAAVGPSPMLFSSLIGNFDFVNPIKKLIDLFKPKPVKKKVPELDKDVKNFQSLMLSMGSRAEQMNILLERLEELFKPALKEMIAVTKKRGYDCNNYSNAEGLTVFRAYKFADAINCILNTDLQTDDGNLNDKEFEKAFGKGQALLEISATENP